MEEKNKTITFVSKYSKSGRKRLINIPSERFEELGDEDTYYKVYLVPIKFDDILD